MVAANLVQGAARSGAGRPFYSCSNYPKTAKFVVLGHRPVAEPCPKCGGAVLTEPLGEKGAEMDPLCGVTSESRAANKLEAEQR